MKNAEVVVQNQSSFPASIETRLKSDTFSSGEEEPSKTADEDAVDLTTTNEGDVEISSNDSASSIDSSSASHSGRTYSHSTLGLERWTSRAGKKGHSHSPDAGECFGADFGGTLSKVVFFEPEDMPEHSEELANLLKSTDTYGSTGFRDKHLSFHSEKLGGSFHFIRFETARTEGAVKMLMKLKSHNMKTLHSTGGGAVKFAKMFKEKLGVTLIREDELETVVRGIVFTLLEHPVGECFSYEPVEEESRTQYKFQNEMEVDMCKMYRPMPVADGSLFPLIVVNIGSGVSLIKVDSPNSFERISGTAIGGGTYYGLAKLLTRTTSYDGAMDLAQDGDSRNVNLLVQDIYGGSYEKVGLHGEMTACYFGKSAVSKGASRPSSSSRGEGRPWVVRWLRHWLRSYRRNELLWHQVASVAVCFAAVVVNIAANSGWLALEGGSGMTAVAAAVANASAVLPFVLLLLYMYKYSPGHAAETGEDESVFEDADICRALVVMVAQNVTQIAFLNARLHGSTRVVFTGNFLRHNPIAMRNLSNSLRIWSKGEISALFMEHEGYFGAMGTFLYSLGLDAKGDNERLRSASFRSE